MGNEKEYTINFKAMPEDISVFDPIEAADADELFDDDEISVEGLIFEAGLTEAVKRLLKKHNDYDIIKFVRTIFDVEYEEGEKNE